MASHNSQHKEMKLSFILKHMLKLREELNGKPEFQTVWLIAQLSTILASPFS